MGTAEPDVECQSSTFHHPPWNQGDTDPYLTPAAGALTDQKEPVCYHNSVNLPKLPVALAVGLFALFAASCVDVANPEGWAAPVFEDGTLYYFSDKDQLDAVAFTTDGSAALLWSFPGQQQDGEEDINIEAVYGEPVVDGDRIYFAGWEGAVYAVSAESGQLLWSTRGRLDITGGVVSGLRCRTEYSSSAPPKAGCTQ